MKSFNKKNTKSVQKQNISLHEAILIGDIAKAGEFCKKIKAANISIIDELNEQGFAPIHIAIKNKNEELVDLLLENGASPNKANSQGDSSLIIAIKNNATNILSRLIEEQADINLSDISGNLPLKIATDLKRKEAIDILTEYGAFIAKKKPAASAVTDIVEHTQNYLDNLITTIKNYTSNGKKLIHFEQFFDEVLSHTQQYTNSKTFCSDKVQKNLAAKLSIIFDRLKIQNSKSNTVDRMRLNMARKIISTFDDVAKEYWIQKGDSDALCLMSRAESAIEEQIVHAKTTSLTSAPHSKTETTNPQETHETTDIPDNNWYTSNNYKNFEDFLKNNLDERGKVKHLKSSEIIKEQILTRNASHDVELIDFVTIRPHHPRTVTEAKELLQLSRKRLSEEAKLFGIKQQELEEQYKQVEELIKKAKKDIPPDEGVLIDKLLRPGKDKKIHIINFPDNRYEDIWSDLATEAFETGATLHSFNYQENISHKNDLVYAGITAVNKVLDDGVHPDAIILSGYGNGAAIANEVNLQFQKRSVYLTQIDCNEQCLSDASHRYVCLIHGKKIDKNCPKDFKKQLSHIIKKSSKILCPKASLLNALNIEKEFSVFQLFNMFINATQNLLNKTSKYKNPVVPKERVDSIVGIVIDNDSL